MCINDGLQFLACAGEKISRYFDTTKFIGGTHQIRPVTNNLNPGGSAGVDNDDDDDAFLEPRDLNSTIFLLQYAMYAYVLQQRPLGLVKTAELCHPQNQRENNCCIHYNHWQ